MALWFGGLISMYPPRNGPSVRSFAPLDRAAPAPASDGSWDNASIQSSSGTPASSSRADRRVIVGSLLEIHWAGSVLNSDPIRKAPASRDPIRVARRCSKQRPLRVFLRGALFSRPSGPGWNRTIGGKLHRAIQRLCLVPRGRPSPGRRRRRSVPSRSGLGAARGSERRRAADSRSRSSASWAACSTWPRTPTTRTPP